MARIFYVHWNRAEALTRVRKLEEAGHQVRFESEEGTAAWNAIRADPPDALVVSLERLPSHGLRTAEVIHSRRDLRNLTLLFVGGDPEKVQLASSKFPQATFVPAEELDTTLASLIPGIPRTS